MCLALFSSRTHKKMVYANTVALSLSLSLSIEINKKTMSYHLTCQLGFEVYLHLLAIYGNLMILWFLQS